MKKATDYQTLQTELDSIVESLQSPEVDVDDAIKLYERGRVVLKELEAYLARAENKVTTIKQQDT
jgi:exodeoxyribonuclease VII small subunit